FLAQKREVSEDVDTQVRAILADVRARGAGALTAFTQRFDRFDVGARGLRIAAEEIAAAVASADPETVAALTLARDRIVAYHQRQVPHDDRYRDALGVELGGRWTAVEAV